jgi:hypothetical protein
MVCVKKLVSLVLALVLAAGLFAPAAIASGGIAGGSFRLEWTSWRNEDGTNISGFELQLILQGATRAQNYSPAEEDVKIAIVPAGTPPGDITEAQKLPVKRVNNGLRSPFRVAVNILAYLIGDHNVYVFAEGMSAPITDGKCYRFRRQGIPIIWEGLDPLRSFAVLEGTGVLNQFVLNVYFYSPNRTFAELAAPDGSTVLREPINSVGLLTFNIPAGLSGAYLLRVTGDDGGSWQSLSYLLLLNSDIMNRRSFGTTIDILHRKPSGLFNSRISSAEIRLVETLSSPMTLISAQVVLEEDFEADTELVLGKLAGGEVTDTVLLLSSADAPFAQDVNMVWRSFGWEGYSFPSRYPFIYTFRYDLGAVPLEAGRIYALIARRGGQTMELCRFEALSEKYVLPIARGELIVAPSSSDLEFIPPDDENPRRVPPRIMLTEGRIIIPEGVKSYTTDGRKWRNIETLNSAGMNRLFDKGMTLTFSDAEVSKGAKAPPADSGYIKFPGINRRGKAPKVGIDYALAHTVNGKVVFDVFDENLWVAVARGTTNILSEGYMYYEEGWSGERDRGTGRPNFTRGADLLYKEGMPIFESDYDYDSGDNDSDFFSYRTTRTSYFITTVPGQAGDAYNPPSRPARLRVSSLIKPKTVKTNYKRETVRLPAGAVVEDPSIYRGIVTAEDAKNPVSITPLLDSRFPGFAYVMAPTAKKPASVFVDVQFAPRNPGRTPAAVWEMEKDGRSVREIFVNESTGRLRVGRGIEFRKKGSERWGRFKIPKDPNEEWEYRFKATARGSRMMNDFEMFFIDDARAIRRIKGDTHIVDLFAAGAARPLYYSLNDSGIENVWLQ